MDWKQVRQALLLTIGLLPAAQAAETEAHPPPPPLARQPSEASSPLSLARPTPVSFNVYYTVRLQQKLKEIWRVKPRPKSPAQTKPAPTCQPPCDGAQSKT